MAMSTDPAPAGTPRSPLRRLLVGMGVGNTLEWYDFGLFAPVAALVFPKLFFPHLDPFAGLLASFATLGVGLLIRPLGAVYFSHVSDRYGRKPILIAALILMGISSLGVGLLPGYHTIGVAAPVMLVLLRCLQGFSAGGEPSAATVLVLESAPPWRRALTIASVNIGAPLGQVLVTLSLLIIRGIVSEAAFLAWAWRIPFLIGFALAIVGWIIRRRIEESPVYRRAATATRRARIPLLTAFRQYPRRVLLLIALVTPPTALFYVGNVYTLTYLKDVLHLPSQVGLSLVLAVNLLGVLLLLLGAAVSDRYGRKPVTYALGALTIVGILLYFPLMNTRMWGLMLLADVLTLGAAHAAGAVRATMSAELFPTQIRTAAHAGATTVGMLIGGSLTPLGATALLHWTGTPWSIAGLLAIGYGISLALLRFLPETVHTDIERVDVQAERVDEVARLDRSVADVG
jgi:MFS family permease